MKRLSELSAPALAGVVRERSVRAAWAEMKNCHLDGAAMIDLHLSCLADQSEEGLRAVLEGAPLPVLALNYATAYDWSAVPYTEEEREELFLRAVRAGAQGVDMQGYTFDPASKSAFVGEDKYSFTKNNPKEIVADSAVIDRQCAFIERVHGMGAEVLLSCHPGVAMDRAQLVELALFLEKRKPDIIKIVSIANTEEDMLEALHAMRALKREVRTPVSYHAGGKFGALMRVLCPLLGGQIAFCVDRFSESSTLEQLSLRSAKTVMEELSKLL